MDLSSAPWGLWTPPADWMRISTLELHTEGEPLRVVVGGFPELEGATLLEQRRFARTNHDEVRRALMWEPRGHADMYGCLVVPPVSTEADFGVLFMHNDGFSTMCGHGIIAVTTGLLETGLLQTGLLETGPADGVARGDDGERRVAIDTPAGLVRAVARMREGRVVGVSFSNVPSFVTRLDARIDVEGVGAVRYDIAYGGAFYAYVDAADFGLRLEPGEAARLVDLGRRIKAAVQTNDRPEHPEADDLGFVYGTIFVGDAHDAEAHSRNVCVFADGEIDRCPTGTGVSGRLAIHDARGDLPGGETIAIESILGTRFTGRVVGRTTVGPHEAVIPEVAGRAWITGRAEHLRAPDDPLAAGFLVR